MKWFWTTCLLLGIAPARAGATDVVWILEPVHVGLERLDAAFTENLGHATRETARIAYGFGAQWGAWSLGVTQGHASAHVDFGLLDGTTARLNRTDTSLELRWRSPRLTGGWRLQPAAGFGRLHLSYRPDSLDLITGGQALRVSLSSESRWTHHVAAELLHDLPGSTQLIVRAAWRRTTLDLGTPTGNTTRSLSDLQTGLAFRVQAF